MISPSPQLQPFYTQDFASFRFKLSGLFCFRVIPHLRLAANYKLLLKRTTLE